MKLSNYLLGGAAVTTAFLLAGCQADKTETTSPTTDTELQQVETEAQEQAQATDNPTNLLWGDTHLHTLNSADAFSFGARLSPADAYKFARGDEVISNSGRAIPCLIHYFHMPTPSYEERVVLNFYIVNGQLTNDESGFSGIGWRTPNITGNAARYVAQVQISSVLENSIREAAKDMTELVLDFFPDENGKVRIQK